jgi:hypothetical protein
VKAAQTGDAMVDSVLNDPVVSKAITNRVVDRTHEIPYTAAASLPMDNPKVYIDKDFPHEFTVSGVKFDPAEPLSVHENAETDVILKLSAQFKKRTGRDPNDAEMGKIYDYAHLNFGEKAEDAWYKSHGIDPKEVDKAYQPYIDKIQKRKVDQAPPADMFTKIYPHGDIDLARKEPLEDPETLKAPGAAAAPGAKGAAFKHPNPDIAALGTNTNPTAKQKKTGKYQKGVAVNVHGVDVAIENPRGSVRSGVDPDGKPWEVVMPDHYGEIVGSKGADGDKVDAYIGKGKKIFVIDQKDLKTNKFDEHKVMLGYLSKSLAKNAYKKGFSDGKGEERIMGIREMQP